ncbi:MAG: GAF domain-containing protein, partial [Cytophagales bacterium]|nr:GAF domain-containing protein [Cytophagales bacterium]
FGPRNEWLDIAYDNTVAKTGFVGQVAILAGIATALGLVLVMVIENGRSHVETDLALNEAQQKQEEAERAQRELQSKIEELHKAQDQEKIRKWMTDGITGVNNIIRTGKDMRQMCDELMAFIIRYLKANQGGIFVAEEDMEGKTQLSLYAAYAYDRKKYMERILAPGQGLVGQTYREKQYLYLSKMPDGYITLRSGLGDAAPDKLLLVPLLNDGQVEGVMEIASFHDIKPHEIKLLEEMGSIMAASFKNTKINQRTQELLDRANEQAAQLKAQEEMMRQGMEELSATQEENARKERLYQDQIKELKERLKQEKAY